MRPRAGKKARAFVVPYRYRDSGWFDYNPMSPVYPLAVWNVSMADEDWQRVERVRETSGYDWRKVFSFRTKEDNGHEQPWQRFLVGDNPTYPDRSWLPAMTRCAGGWSRFAQDHSRHKQGAHPSLANAQPGGDRGADPAHAGRAADSLQRRPAARAPALFRCAAPAAGTAQDVAALVEKLEPARTVVRLVNLSPNGAREVLLQAELFGEHQFVRARYLARASEYPGAIGTYAAPTLQTEERVVPVGSKHLTVALPPASEIVLDLEMARYVNTPLLRTAVVKVSPLPGRVVMVQGAMSSVGKRVMVVLGRPMTTLAARQYDQHKAALWHVVTESLEELRAVYDLVVIKGPAAPPRSTSDEVTSSTWPWGQ